MATKSTAQQRFLAAKLHGPRRKAQPAKLPPAQMKAMAAKLHGPKRR